jgi:uncharacterized protein (TIGR01244 family)
MADIRRVTDSFSVAPQLLPDEIAEAAAQGFRLIINNRPDDEAPDQPPSAVMASAAQAAGLDYLHIPVSGMAAPGQVEAMHAAVKGAAGPVLAFCRSGTRSITTWARGEQEFADRSRTDLIQLTREAGYDLSTVLR